jgi:hypothetical protein
MFTGATARAGTPIATTAATATPAVGATSTAAAGTPYVDGISDQSLPAWDGGFSGSYFARLFSSVWVSGGHIRLARYVVQWDVMREASAGADAHGDYRERLEAWLEDVADLGLVPDVALTSYDGIYPQSTAEYEASLQQLLERARAMGRPLSYVEAWNEPNNQGALPAVRAAQLTNGADALCEGGDRCRVVAGNLEDSPEVAGYEREYEQGLDFSPAIWGVHPYYSVEERSEAPLENFQVNLPHGGAGAQIWFTEIAARACTDYGGRLVEDGAGGQAERAAWLVDTLMRNRRPEHVFYNVFLLADGRRPSCSTEHEDDALYQPGQAAGGTAGPPGAGGTAAGPDTPRPAAGYVWDGRAGEPPGVCSEPLTFEAAPAPAPHAIAWSAQGEAGAPSLTVLTDGCGAPTR